MNELGFMSNDISTIGNLQYIGAYNRWDHQTIVFICNDNTECNRISSLLRSRRKNQSHTDSANYQIDGFVNLNYSPNEKNPANRNVRLVYCDGSRMTLDEIIDRFSDGYIIKVERKEDNYIGTSRISRELPQIPCRTRNA